MSSQLELFLNAGADVLTFHIETLSDVNRLIDYIKSNEKKVGIAINPDTQIGDLKDIISKIDLVCLMGVHPGFAGQKFIDKTLDRLIELKNLIESNNAKTLIEVDGGVNANNYMKLRSLGADVLVAGSYIFNSEDYNEVIKKLKE